MCSRIQTGNIAGYFFGIGHIHKGGVENPRRNDIIELVKSFVWISFRG